MEFENRKIMSNQSTQIGAMPETVILALMSASDEISDRENWVFDRSGGIAPRLLAAIVGLERHIDEKSALRSVLRQKMLRLLAYLPADLRLSTLVELTARAPLALNDLFSGEIPKSCEIYRYNLISSLGTFARHGLVEEVFTYDRINRVGSALRDSRPDAIKKRDSE